MLDLLGGAHRGDEGMRLGDLGGKVKDRVFGKSKLLTDKQNR